LNGFYTGLDLIDVIDRFLPWESGKLREPMVASAGTLWALPIINTVAMTSSGASILVFFFLGDAGFFLAVFFVAIVLSPS
jgi:hypothetical protein